MCGIIGYIGEKDCSNFILSGLKRLEYRGYDSAGIACNTNGQGFKIVKEPGKLEVIEKILKDKPLAGTIGIGHTRWATHGKPNALNAHPHRAGTTVLVHNGIIENYETIREDLKQKGFKIVSETDSELFGHLVEEQLKAGLTFDEAVRQSFLKLEGSCSIVVVNDKFPDRIIAIRNGTPLVVAHAPKVQGCFVASDAQAIIEFTNNVAFLENEDLVICEKTHFDVYSIHKPIKLENKIHRKPVTLDWTVASLDKAGFPHYMLKEIYEQPRTILDTLDNLIDRESGLPRMQILDFMLKKASKIHIVACGTAWHAGLVGKYVIEQVARIPVEVDLASEYRYREPIVDSSVLFLAVSQSGETADTLAALREAKSKGAMTVAICNVRGASITRDADATLFTVAGPEIGVASTKAFTGQVLVLMMLAQYASHLRKIKSLTSPDLKFFLKLPHLVQSILQTEAKIKEIAKATQNSKGFLFIGRGRLFPIALEGALKTKEIAYVHAEGYPAGELKHGPIAMVEPEMTLVVLAPRDDLYEKTISNLQEVKARGGKIISVGTRGDTQLQKLSDYSLEYDFSGDWADPLLSVIPLQLLAYHLALLKGTDVDKPRNLAKSVTVE